ncbi:MAG: hypothetical protein MJK12_20265, partial [Colwellia sp.]|nr:hypothetical protein [Colwellia sp.]
DALLASAAAPDNEISEEEVPDGADVTDPDDIDALLAAAGVPEQDSKPIVEITDEDITEVDEKSENIEELAGELSDNTAKIEGFAEEYIAPFLAVDFSDMTSNETTSIDNDNEVISDDIIDSIDDDELDIDALISQVNGEVIADNDTLEDDSLDIGDDLLSGFDIDKESGDENVVDEETMAALSADFDESTLTQLLNDEKSSNSSVELSPDFTDQNVLADLLADHDNNKEDVTEATEIEDIQELDSLDFDELLANIEEESTVSSDVDALELEDDFDIPQDSSNEQDDSTSLGNDRNFVSVDSLLSDSLEDNMIEEPYDKANIEVGLNDFPEFTADTTDIDVDEDAQGVTAKLDLAKVYIEIGDAENAEIILSDVVSQGDAQQQLEAQQLLDSLNT